MNNPSQTKDMNELNNKISGILAVFHDEIINRGPYDPMRVSKASQEARNQIQNLITEQVRLGRIDELKRAASHNNSEYTSDYLEDRIAQLKDTTLLEGVDNG